MAVRDDYDVRGTGEHEWSKTFRRFLKYLSGRSAETWAFFAAGLLLGAFFG